MQPGTLSENNFLVLRGFRLSKIKEPHQTHYALYDHRRSLPCQTKSAPIKVFRGHESAENSHAKKPNESK